MRLFPCKLKHKLKHWGLVLTLASAVFVAGERQANAAIPVAVVVAVAGYVEKAYNLFKQFRTLLGGDGPSLATQLDGVKTAIINEMRTQRDQQWRATAQNALDKFSILAARAPGHPDNPALRDEASNNATLAIEQLAIIVDDGSDVESVYQLAPTFNTLAWTQSLLTVALDEIFAPHLSPWQEFHIYFLRTIQADYKMVGAQFIQCWPGFDPGAGNYTVSLPTHNTQTFTGSQLWKKIANFSVIVETVKGTLQTANVCKVTETNLAAWCNPGTKQCLKVGACVSGVPKIVFPKSDSLQKAEIAAAPTFAADNTVKIIRDSMNRILQVGGGEDPGDAARTDLPLEGALVDPWVDEPVKCPASAPWAYATVP